MIDIAVEDPRTDDIRALLSRHLAFSRSTTPPECAFALEVEQLLDPAVTFFTAREEGRLVGIAALRRLDQHHSELKSMHTSAAERGRGVGRALVEHILAFAQAEGCRRVSLETGATDEFVPARALYAKVGFLPCDQFGSYRASAYNTFMTLSLEPALR